MASTLQAATSVAQRARSRITVRGAVQGVGFRPFVFRLSRELGLSGWVRNTCAGVTIEVEGAPRALRHFAERLETEKPAPARLTEVRVEEKPPTGETGFVIQPSDRQGPRRALVLPDLATCPACRREVFDPADRRHLYPFTNCTHCGPRYSIMERVPYDRAHTTMKVFTMCARCRAEYEDPANRRFHAQPNACPDCGPQLAWWTREGKVLATRHDALLAAAAALRNGGVVAVKGLGGFHLMADARSDEAVARLRERKRREGKPFALMYPSLDAILADCRAGDLEKELLTSAEAPIVILERADHAAVSGQVAPDNHTLGVMLPYTPLHHILLRELGFPVVATSGNLSEEPICIDEHEALARLASIADFFLVHDRPIARHVDDSIVRVMAGQPVVLRRARGYAPRPVELPASGPPLLAVGGHLKNTVAVSRGREACVGQHIGDLETEQAYAAFEASAADLQELHDVTAEGLVHDLHPAYASTHFALESPLPRTGVQHHFAHVAACMADNRLKGTALGVAWDGTGYGGDGTVWGGEFLVTSCSGFRRAGHFRTFPLPGGDKAVIEPRRAALGLLFELYGGAEPDRAALAPADCFTAAERRTLWTMMRNQVNAPRTSSVGRLFDAAAALLGLCRQARFEGQAAMRLEALADPAPEVEAYPFDLQTNRNDGEPPTYILDWGPAFEALLRDRQAGRPVEVIATRFHLMLVESILALARRTGRRRVVLTGGCFQNRFLTEQAVARLRAEGFEPYWHRQVPPNDGGIAFGQLVAALGAVEEH